MKSLPTKGDSSCKGPGVGRTGGFGNQEEAGEEEGEGGRPWGARRRRLAAREGAAGAAGGLTSPHARFRPGP